MKTLTKSLWSKQDQHEGDRQRLFSAVGAAIDAERVLYAGSYVDIAPSFVWPSVTYVDSDKRAEKFFDDSAGVLEIIADHGSPTTDPSVAFVASDYGADLELEDESFDLLISLYAGFVSEHCTRYLRVGGSLLVNPSHGDAAMASVDSRYALTGVIMSRDGQYTVKTGDPNTGGSNTGSSNTGDTSENPLAAYMKPKKPIDVTVDLLHNTGRGIAYTKPAFAYLFTRVE